VRLVDTDIRLWIHPCVDWQLLYINSTRDSGLYVLCHKGRVGPGMYANLERPRELSRRPYNFDVGLKNESLGRSESSVFATEQLAEQLMTGLVEDISG
jgi:hypothetical protein